METGSRYAELVLGGIVTGVIGLLVWLSFAVGGGAPRNAVDYALLFDSALGLSEDNAVAIAGVKVGIVSDIGIDGRKAKVIISIDPKVNLHQNAVAAVRAKTLLGEKYVDLDPGAAPAPILNSGATLNRNTPTVEIDQVIRSAAQLVTSLNSMTPPLEMAIARLDLLLQETDGTSVTQELARTLEDAGKLIRKTSMLVSDSGEDFGFLLDLSREKGPKLIERISRASDRIDQLLASVEPNDLKYASDRIKPTIDDVGSVVTDLKVAMHDIRNASSRMDNILAKVDRALTRTEEINERAVREFLQVEGVRVNLIPDEKIERRVKQLRNESPPLPVP
jgi:phospholipid/cholesterol/gamma-HCH transport system substrate-binding protein